jgi:hypothetical protein
MAEDPTMSDRPASFAAALAALQADLPRIPKTGRAQVQNRQTTYAPYDQIIRRVRPVLAKHGFVWITMPTLTSEHGDTRFVLAYRLTHLATGASESGEYPLTEGPAQQQGSQISYAKRYALVAILDLEVVGEDDDGMERTPAKVTGPEHERLRHGTVEPVPEDRPAERIKAGDPPPVDMWTDQPSGNFDIGTPEDQPGSIDDRQLRELQAKFRTAGIDDRDVRLGMVTDWIGREILTAKQLSQAEALYVIKKLKERQAGG